MKHKKSLRIGAMVILAVALIAVVAWSLATARQKEDVLIHGPGIGGAVIQPGNSTPKGAVSGMLSALRDWDLGLAAQWMNEAPEGIFSDTYHGVLAPSLGRLEFDCGTERVSGSTAVVDVAVTSVDVGAALGDLTADAAGYLLNCSMSQAEPDWAEFLTGYAGAMESSDLLRVKRHTEAHLIQDAGGKWRLDLKNPENRAFFNAVTGGILDVLDYLREVTAIF